MRNTFKDYTRRFCRLRMNYACHLSVTYYIAGAETVKIILRLIQTCNSAQSAQETIINTII